MAKTSSLSGRYNKKSTARNLLDWRRIKVQEYWNKGWDIKRIAKELHVTERIVYEDQRYIEKHADSIMRDYLSNTVPHIVNRSLQRLELINTEAWNILEKSEDKRTRLSAMQVIGKTAIDSVTIVTGIRELIDFALDRDKYVQALQNIESLSSKKESDQQNEEESDNDNNDSNLTNDTEREAEEQSFNSES